MHEAQQSPQSVHIAAIAACSPLPSLAMVVQCSLALPHAAAHAALTEKGFTAKDD